ncbi:DUF5694 domain-containing protein [Halobacterium wangiae]|uniref:DUF5694 domain-containing protein n=1 Tax=Halobacterium wangiae TaxID=2902623 RepID=UPI001E5869CC|nr:DUF5694 domain-containing protein [Halobacterium wangiae]
MPDSAQSANGRVEETVDDAFWPAPRPGQVRVLLLGTYHMDNPGLDEVNVDADDVLGEDRQGELRDLADRLERWKADRVAVERPWDRAADLNDVYQRYRSGAYDYDTEHEFESTHGMRDDAATECRSEVVQIGFRLADRLGHERVAPIDCPAMMGNDATAELAERGYEPERKVDVPRLDTDSLQRTRDERLASSTIPDYHRMLNRERELLKNHAGMFGMYVPYGEGENFGGPAALGTWYERNLKMVHNLWRAVDADAQETGDEERILLVVGSGHVRVLRHLLDETPQFCPVNPLPSLS